MPVLGGAELLLPINANVGGAFQQLVSLGAKPAGVDPLYIVGANFYEVLVTVFMQVTLGPTVGNRLINIDVQDPDLNHAYQVPMANAAVANTTATATWGTNLQQSSGVGGLTQTNTLPILVMFPGWRVSFGLNSFQDPADKITSAVLIVLRFPTGTPASQLAAALPAARV